jgi:hypothetical protein
MSTTHAPPPLETPSEPIAENREKTPFFCQDKGHEFWCRFGPGTCRTFGGGTCNDLGDNDD